MSDFFDKMYEAGFCDPDEYMDFLEQRGTDAINRSMHPDEYCDFDDDDVDEETDSPMGKYRLLWITHEYLDRFGKVYFIYANPSEKVTDGGCTWYSSNLAECEKTEIFVYPHDENLIQPINSIGLRMKLWAPNPEDYDGNWAKTIKLENGKEYTVHYYKSLENRFFKRILTISTKEVRYNDSGWIKLPNLQHWDFAISNIPNPYGPIGIWNFSEIESQDIESIIEGDKGDFFGIKLLTDGCVVTEEMTGYDGNEEILNVSSVIVLGNNVLRWISLYDPEGKHIVTLKGVERRVVTNDLERYIDILHRFSYHYTRK